MPLGRPPSFINSSLARLSRPSLPSVSVYYDTFMAVSNVNQDSTLRLLNIKTFPSPSGTSEVRTRSALFGGIVGIPLT